MNQVKFMLVLLLSVTSTMLPAQTVKHIFIDGGSSGAPADLERALENYRQVANVLHKSFESKVFKADDTNLLSYLQSLRATNDDIIIVQVSTHSRNSGDSWPALIGRASNGSPLAIKMTSIMNKCLVHSGAGLKIVMWDGCNVGRTTEASPSRRDIILPLKDEIVQTLFANTKGEIIICSSAEDRVAYSAPNYGGYFSRSYWEANYNTSIIGKSPLQAWTTLLEDAKRRTNAKCTGNGYELQNAKWEINLSVSTQTVSRNVPTVAPNVPAPKATTTCNPVGSLPATSF